MFALNRTYTITMLEASGDELEETHYYGWQPVEIEMPVVRFECDGKSWIINTSSPRFVGAKADKAVPVR